MTRSLLLLAALGYFLAAVHTYEHIAFDTCHSCTVNVQDAADTDEAESHECLICTVQSHFISLLPSYEGYDLPTVEKHPDQPHSFSVAAGTLLPGLHCARAPPLS